MSKAILLVGNHPPPYGGVPTHIQYLAPYLVEEGWEVHVLSLAGTRGRSYRRMEDTAGYRVHRPGRWIKWSKAPVPSPWTRVAWRFKTFMREHPRGFVATLGIATLIGQIARRHDVNIISAYHVMAGLPSAWVSEALAIPLVTTIFGEIYSRPNFYRLRRREVEYICAVSRRVLSCSRHCARSLESIGVHHPVESVYYGVDTRKFSPDNDGTRVRSKLGISTEDSVVLFVGRMATEMGLHILLSAIPGVLEADPAIRFIIAGARGELTEEARAVAARMPENVNVVTDVPIDELPFYYAAATIAVAPSINDRACLGLAVAEAMASGKQVIVSNAGGGTELVENGVGGFLVPARDPAALARAIGGLLQQAGSPLASRLARDRARSLFDKDLTNLRMERVFSEALD